MPNLYSSLLNTLIDWTDSEIANGKKFLDWNEVSIHWEDLDLHWEDIFIILESKRGGSSSGSTQKEDLRRYVEGNPWRQLKQQVGEENAEKVIKVLCKINGVDYNSILENKDNIRVVVNDFVRRKEENQIKIKVKF